MTYTVKWCYGNEDGFHGAFDSREEAIEAARRADEQSPDLLPQFDLVAKLDPITWEELCHHVTGILWDWLVWDQLYSKVDRDGRNPVADAYGVTAAPEVDTQALDADIAAAFEKHVGPVKCRRVTDVEPIPTGMAVTS